MAGKEGVFEVAVKEVRHRLPPALDDELAKAVGLETLTELRQEVRQRMQRDYAGVARQRLKRALLDKLSERYDFGVPPGMVEIEFNSIWAQYEADKARQKDAAAAALEAGAAPNPPEENAGEVAAPTSEPAGEPIAPAPGDSPAAEGEDEEKTKTDFRRIAERRVRLGLLLAEVGRSNNITVSQEELNQALTQEARRLPGYERQVIDYYRKNPDAMNNLRAPIFEDKVVDFIVELAKPEERKVTPQELMTGAEADGESAAPEA